MESTVLSFIKDNGVWLSSLVSAITGGVLVTFFGPRVQWGIEKKRETRAHRRDLIARWRTMVSDIAQEAAKQEAARLAFSAYDALQRHADYASFKVTYDRYCRSGFRGVTRWFTGSRIRRWLEPWWPRRPQPSPERTLIAGSSIPARLSFMIGQIGDIERWWGLD